MRLFAASNPGSTGLYSATWAKYDALGSAVARSDATEITGDGTAACDDQTASYQFTKQAYDWKGRLTLTTYPTGTGQTSRQHDKTLLRLLRVRASAAGARAAR